VPQIERRFWKRAQKDMLEFVHVAHHGSHFSEQCNTRSARMNVDFPQSVS